MIIRLDVVSSLWMPMLMLWHFISNKVSCLFLKRMRMQKLAYYILIWKVFRNKI